MLQSSHVYNLSIGLIVLEHYEKKRKVKSVQSKSPVKVYKRKKEFKYVSGGK